MKLVVVLLFLVLTLSGQAQAADHSEGIIETTSHKKYWPEVRKARAWLKNQYNRRQWRCLDHLWVDE